LTGDWASRAAAVSNFDVMPRRPSQLGIAVGLRIFWWQQDIAMKMEWAPATKHSACNSSSLLPAADSRTTLFGMHDSRHRDHAHQAIGSGVGGVVDGNALDLVPQMIGTLSGWTSGWPAHQHAQPVADLLPHSDDAAAANLSPALPHGERMMRSCIVRVVMILP